MFGAFLVWFLEHSECCCLERQCFENFTEKLGQRSKLGWLVSRKSVE